MAPRIKIDRQEVEASDLVVISIDGRLDIHSLELFRETLGREADAGQFKVILDFNGVSFIISTYVGLILSFQKDAKNNNGDLKLAGLGKEVYSIFDLMGITDLIDIKKTVEEAIEGYQVLA